MVAPHFMDVSKNGGEQATTGMSTVQQVDGGSHVTQTVGGEQYVATANQAQSTYQPQSASAAMYQPQMAYSQTPQNGAQYPDTPGYNLDTSNYNSDGYAQSIASSSHRRPGCATQQSCSNTSTEKHMKCPVRVA